MPEGAESYVSENKYLISLYILRYIFSGLAKNRPPKSPFRFNRLDFLPYYSAPSGIRPLEGALDQITLPVTGHQTALDLFGSVDDPQ